MSQKSPLLIQQHVISHLKYLDHGLMTIMVIMVAMNIIIITSIMNTYVGIYYTLRSCLSGFLFWSYSVCKWKEPQSNQGLSPMHLILSSSTNSYYLQRQYPTYTTYVRTSISVLLIVGPNCTLAALHAAPW